MKITIQGHPTRGKEVIKILESFGGVNRYALNGNSVSSYYYINYNYYNNLIHCHSDKYVDEYYKKYTLEEFEKEFPFKIGDMVLLKGVNKPYKIIALEWYMNELCYKLDNELHYAPETLTTYEKMKEERNITLTLDKAKEWYNKGGELKEIALQAFSKNELNPLPRSWEEYCRKYGYVCLSTRYTNLSSKYDALIKLEQLRDCWRQGWEPSKHDTGHAIIIYHEGYSIKPFRFISFLSFPTYEMAEEFLNCFKDLIEKAGDLI